MRSSTFRRRHREEVLTSCELRLSRESKSVALSSDTPGSRTLLAFDGFLLPEAAVDLGKQRVFAGLAADAQIIAVRFRKPRAFQTFPHTSLEVIDGRKITEGGDIIHEELQGFAAPLDASIEFRIRFHEEPGLEIDAAKLEMSDPRIQQGIGLRQCFNGLARVSPLHGQVSSNYFGISSGFSFQLRS